MCADLKANGVWNESLSLVLQILTMYVLKEASKGVIWLNSFKNRAVINQFLADESFLTVIIRELSAQLSWLQKLVPFSVSKLAVVVSW